MKIKTFYIIIVANYFKNCEMSNHISKQFNNIVNVRQTSAEGDLGLQNKHPLVQNGTKLTKDINSKNKPAMPKQKGK